MLIILTILKIKSDESIQISLSELNFTFFKKICTVVNGIKLNFWANEVRVCKIYS